MKALGKILLFLMMASGLLNSIMFLGTVIDLLESYIGIGAYLAAWFVAPILSPAFLFFPWFDAWVTGDAVNSAVLYIWISFWVCLILRVIMMKWAPDDV